MTEKIVSVGRDVDLQLRSLAKTSFCDFFGGVIVKLDTELEAEFVELLSGVGAAKRLVEVFLVDGNGGHGCRLALASAKRY